MSASSWPARRAEFNHDWLKNGFIPLVGRALNVGQGAIEMQDGGSGLLGQVIREWKARGHEARNLALEFRLSMSPASLFLMPPLANLDIQTERWLPPLVNHLWFLRYPVEQWIGAALEAHDKVAKRARLLE